MAEILLLGTFHFMESKYDVLSTDNQREIAKITKRLLQFAPDAVAVEAPVHAQNDLDQSYSLFQLTDFDDESKMQQDTLGDIHIYGGIYPITYTNESVQIGYRLAKLAKLPTVHGIDNDASLDMTCMQYATPLCLQAQSALDYDLDVHAEDSLPDLLKYYNSERYSMLHHSIYIQANSIHLGDDLIGTKMVTDWYTRNINIFHNLQMLSLQYKRIFVLFGAGHLHLLKSFILADQSMTLVEPDAFL